uniref:Uncharacterized protein n=1 Tax=viral metagenome TaxID=1070528 RepID=A0A6M3J2G1_9ZZZZ
MEISKSDFKEVMNLEFDEKDEVPFKTLNIYDFIKSGNNLDEDLERSHAYYSFCTILAAEIDFVADTKSYMLDLWAAKKWAKLKASVRKKYTDNDAKRKIEGSIHYLRERIEISRLRKLAKQIGFGGGRAIDMKANNLRQMIYREHRALTGNFNIKDVDIERDASVSKFIKNRLK